MRHRYIIPSLIGALVLVLVGCASNLATKRRLDTPLPVSSRVALLPFENLSGREKAAEKLTDYFLTSLARHNQFETVEFGQLYDVLRQHRIRSASLLTDEQIDSLAVSLGVDYILVGSPLEYNEYDNNFLGRVPQVSFNCRLIDCSDKKTIWVASSNGRGDKGELIFGIGVVRSADNLARKMVEEAVGDLSQLFAKE